MDELEQTLTENEILLQKATNPGFFAGLWGFVMDSKKWWIIPPLLLLLLLGILLALSHTAAAPFIYTMF